jgi:hypothetical protein
MEPRCRRCIAVDETKLRVKKSYVYIWSAVDVDSRELLALEASYGRSSLNALSFLKKALRMCVQTSRWYWLMGVPGNPDLRYPLGKVVDGRLAYRLQTHAKDLGNLPTATMEHVVQHC